MRSARTPGFQDDDDDESLAALRSALAKARSEAQAHRDEWRAAMEQNDEISNQLFQLEAEMQKLRARKDPTDFPPSSPVGLVGGTGETDGSNDMARQVSTLTKRLADSEQARRVSDAKRLRALEERDLLAHEREEYSQKSSNTIAALQQQYQKLQHHCMMLHDASMELQVQMDVLMRENGDYRASIEEMRQVLAAKQANAADENWAETWGLGACVGDRKPRTSEPESLGAELGAELRLYGADGNGEEGKAKRRGSLDARPSTKYPNKKTRLEELQAKYNTTFERQQKQLDDAMKRKEAIEKEKDDAIHKLQEQIVELQKKLPNESQSIGGLFDMLSKIQAMTLAASDSLILSLADEPKPPQVDTRTIVSDYATATTAPTGRDRFQARKDKKYKTSPAPAVPFDQ